MKLNKKLLAVGIALLILLWTGNIYYYEKRILKEPLFIKCYYVLPNDTGIFNLSYIQNINSQDKIASITFPKLGIQPLSFQEVDMNSDNKYYMLKMVSIDLFNDFTNNLKDAYKNKLITKANITFTSGKTMTVDLGKICFSGYEIQSKNLIQDSISSSTDNIGGVTFRAQKDLTLLIIKNNSFEESKDLLKIRIDEKDLSDVTFPIELKKGQVLYMNYEINHSVTDIRKNYSCNLDLDILTADSQGNKEYSSFYLTPSLNQSPKYYDIETLKNQMEEN